MSKNVFGWKNTTFEFQKQQLYFAIKKEILIVRLYFNLTRDNPKYYFYFIRTYFRTFF